jgi:hypothetical protein
MSDVFAEMMEELQGEADRVLTEPNKRQNVDYLAKYLKLPKKEGVVTVRMLPPVHGLKMPFQATRLHTLVINGKKRNIHCPNPLVKEGKQSRWIIQPKVCPMCDHYKWLWAQAENAGGRESPKAKPFIDKASKLRPYERYYYNCVVREDPSQEGVKIFPAGIKLHRKIIQYAAGDPKFKIKPLGNIWDVTGKTGRDFMIVVTTQGDFANYDTSNFLGETCPLGTEEEIKEWLANAHNLAELRVLKTYDELKHLYRMSLGLVEDTSSAFDPSEFEEPGEEDTPTPTVAAATKKPTPQPQTKPQPKPQPVVVVEDPPFDVDDVPSGKTDDDVLPDADFLEELKNM